MQIELFFLAAIFEWEHFNWDGHDAGTHIFVVAGPETAGAPKNRGLTQTFEMSISIDSLARSRRTGTMFANKKLEYNREINNFYCRDPSIRGKIYIFVARSHHRPRSATTAIPPPPACSSAPALQIG